MFLKDNLKQAVKNNPAYGCRKLQAELKEVYGYLINLKPLKKLLRLWDLTLPRLIAKPKPNRIIKLIQSGGTKANLLKAIENPYPFQILVTDFIWLYFCQGEERLAVATYVDYGSKILVGYALGKAQNTQLALRASEETKNGLAKRGIDPKKVTVQTIVNIYHLRIT